MDLMPAALSAQMAITRNNAVMGMMKQSAQADQQIATLLANAVESVSGSGRGSLINMTA